MAVSINKLFAADVYFQTDDALLHDVFPGFKEDYLCLHSLLRLYNPEIILEIGTNIGWGVNVMSRACPDAKIFSLDLEYGSKKSSQYPVTDKGDDRVGSAVTVPYTQLRGDSMTFDYFYADAWFIDGEHDYFHVHHETTVAASLHVKLIIWHDTDMPQVWAGLKYALTKDYDLYRIADTRISFAVLNKFRK